MASMVTRRWQRRVFAHGWAAALLVALLGVALAAVVPPLGLQRQPSTVPAIATRQLELEAARGFAVPPGWAQVADIRASGPYPYRVEGTVIYRTLFGLPVASARTYNGATAYALDRARLAMVVLGFFVVEGALIVGLLRQQRAARWR